MLGRVPERESFWFESQASRVRLQRRQIRILYMREVLRDIG